MVCSVRRRTAPACAIALFLGAYGSAGPPALASVPAGTVRPAAERPATVLPAPERSSSQVVTTTTTTVTTVTAPIVVAGAVSATNTSTVTNASTVTNTTVWAVAPPQVALDLCGNLPGAQRAVPAGRVRTVSRGRFVCVTAPDRARPPAQLARGSGV